MTHYTNTSNPVDFPEAESKTSALIEKLALQANAWYPGGYPSAEGGDEAWKNSVIFERQDLEQFVRSIVEQCIRLAGPEDSYTDDWFRAKADSVNKIKEHFGVE